MLEEDCVNCGGSVDQKLWFVKSQPVWEKIFNRLNKVQPVEKIMFNLLGKVSGLF